jgi:tetratricopeptide (TPR) repeat protein
MIVKNEAANLGRALESLRGVVDELLVVDTGSTDGTQALAESLGARVLAFAWTGRFADARNFALGQARGAWALIMDADEALHPDDRPLLGQLVAGDTAEAYICTVVNYIGDGVHGETLIDHRVSLLRRRPEYRYTGALHENLQDRILAARPDAPIAVVPLRILHYGYLDAELARAGKRERNRAILAAQLAAQPGDPFLQYALAVECLALGDLAEAQALLAAALAAAPSEAQFRPDVLLKLAACCRGHPEAEAWLRQAAEEFPDFTDVWFQLAGICLGSGRLSEAETCLRLCLALGEAPPQYQSWQGSGTYRAWAALAELYERKGRSRAARHACVGALRAGSPQDQILPRLACLLAAEPAGAAVAELARDFDLSAGGTAAALAAALRRAGAPLHAGLLLREVGGEADPAGALEQARSYLQAAAVLVKPADRELCERLRRLGGESDR